jgi:hypothetical protein
MRFAVHFRLCGAFTGPVDAIGLDLARLASLVKHDLAGPDRARTAWVPVDGRIR